MELTSISIKNYRSIRDLTLDVKKTNGSFLQTLLGVNESGKSNILKAIYEMGDKNAMNYEQDCEKEARRRGDSIKISFIYELDEAEVKKFNELLSESKINLIREDNRKVIIKKSLTLTKNSEKINEWLPVISEGVKFVRTEERIAPEKENSPELEVSFDELKNAIKKKGNDNFLEKSSSKVVYWKATPEYLITNPINLSQFKGNKNINIPLKNIFHLIGMTDDQINEMIDRSKRDHSERRKISKEISEKATEYINEVWPEHKISFEVTIESNDNCFVHIMDKESEELFSMNERSDGFKQFISILLTLSAEVRSKLLNKNIILIDEPEVNLHPSSIQYLRDELMKIAQDNYLIIASHSIFIIDKKNLERHLKVFKERDGTKIEAISPNNPFAEEIVYRSLGTSIYEIIEPYILVFEGRTDKEIYDAFYLKFKDEGNVSKLKTIAATGVNEIRKYLKFFNQKTVTGIVLVDSDRDGKGVLTVIKENDSDFADSSFEILDIINLGKNEATLEDLLPKELIKEAFFEVYDTELPELKDTESVVAQIKEFKSTRGISGDYNLNDLKVSVLGKVLKDMELPPQEIKTKYASYVDFFNKLNDKIRNIQTTSR